MCLCGLFVGQSPQSMQEATLHPNSRTRYYDAQVHAHEHDLISEMLPCEQECDTNIPDHACLQVCLL